MAALMITVRFKEITRYDILQDCDVIQFVATTDRGSYHAEVPDYSSRMTRELRSRFKERTEQCIERKQPPCEIDLSDYDA